MTDDEVTLHMVCGKIASGKTTLSAELVSRPGTVLIAEDDWLAALFGDELVSGADYVRCSARLRNVMGPLVISLLQAGVSVVLDFPANTIEVRNWMREIFTNANASHQLHFLDVSEEICLKRLRERNASGEHAFAPNERQFRRFSKHFTAPLQEEGFNVVKH
ncbi:MAG: ATP-binding protein [Pseudomonadota bacterium]